MKNIYRTLSFLLVIFFTSCSDNEGAIYNGNLDEFTFLTTNGTSFELQVIRDSTGVLTIPFKASTLSPKDRTYPIELVQPIEGVVVADPTTYNLPTSVTIPANQWTGDIVITGQDLELVELEAKPFSFKIGLGDKEFMDDDIINIGVVEVCILGENATFTGNYVVTNIVSSSYVGQIGFPFAENSVVTLTASSEFIRTFSATYYPNFWGLPVDFSFNLQCDDVWVNDFDTGARCAAEAPTIKILRGDSPGSYNHEDDSEIIITYNDDYGSCGSNSPQQITFKLTKQ